MVVLIAYRTEPRPTGRSMVAVGSLTADLAKLTAQPVVAPCNGKANISGAGRDGVKLAQNSWASVTPTWMVYNPDGTSENL